MIEAKKEVALGIMQVDSIVRPLNTTAYGAQQSINCNITVSAGSYDGLTVTLTSSGHTLSKGDAITVAGVNTGYTWANVDGNWIVSAVDSTTFSFVVTSQPTGTTPATGSITGCVAKMLKFSLGRSNGGIVSIRRVTVNMPGVGVGALRLWLYNAPVSSIVDQAGFTILSANNLARVGYIDLYPVTEASGSSSSIAIWQGELIVPCESTSTNIYARLEKEGTDNSVVSVSAGTIYVKVVGYQM